MASPAETASDKCKNLYAYLKSLPGSLLDSLYKHPCPCMAVFRDLPPMAQKFVLRQLFIEHVLPKSTVLSWVTPEGKKDHDDALKVLTELKIWTEAPLPSGSMGWKLSDDFREGIQAVVVGGRTSWSGDDKPTEEEAVPRDAKFLEAYAQERWETVLHFLAGLGSSKVSLDTCEVLTNAGLLKKPDSSREGDITHDGFRFLLMDTPTQIWNFILAYLQSVQKWNMNLVECIAFIFQLSFSQIGKHYSSNGLSQNQLRTLQHFREYGLVYMRSKKSARFYPTNLVVNLSVGAARSTGAFSEGYLVVETNYRVYAYTDSPLKIAVVSYFSEMMYRFPNLSMGMITRESIRAALAKGISADEIIKFLRMHAHPQMRENNPILPATLTDQIKLWEMERERVEFSEGTMYSQFNSLNDFERLRDYAKDLGVVMFTNNEKRVIIVSPEGHEQVKAFWKRQKNA
ncbi:general transcription factor IIH subunit 4-like [Paramacrobiotus metropolitanus]|uniref:general transcription factor IIH subunit 4-like n=1 Tax=Paramacrobiotus metropolitanus TaxID=2943436 RepID=UPI0024463C38|nr:general transcription factor IIH subunit 4-like [Paramacrobiotus metropolitanus]